MLYIVDGTGDGDDNVYNQDMGNGFCRRMEREFNGKYRRGPTTNGFTTFDIARKVYEDILADRRLGKEPLYLAGHSRGGASVIHVAHRLKDRKIEVRAMFLFDAVDRTLQPSTETERIPLNVRICYHAMRDRSHATYYDTAWNVARTRYEGCLARNGILGNACAADKKIFEDIDRKRTDLRYAMRTENMVRMNEITLLGHKVRIKPDASIDFGNTGTMEELTCGRLVKSEFKGTHGAIGGAPIRAPDTADKDIRYLVHTDNIAVREVKTWMWSKIQEAGLSAPPLLLNPAPNRYSNVA